MKVFVARQPILDTKKKTVAYEIFFRDGIKNAFPDMDGDIATLKLISNSFGIMGIDSISNGKPVFINFPQDLIEKQIPLYLPKEQLVIEVLEDVKADNLVIESVNKFKKNGYTIALDDFVYHKDLQPLINKADIIKFDFRISSFAEIREMIANLSSINKIKFLAEKIETHEEFEQALEMGCSYFQGYFFDKPKVLSDKSIPMAKTNLIKLLAQVAAKDIDFEKLAQTIRVDVAMSFLLLKLTNSAFYKRRYPIESVRDAVLMLGEKEIKQFVMLISVVGLSAGHPDEMVTASVIRGYICESIGSAVKTDFSNDELFTLGLFKNIDAMLEITMERVLKVLPFSTRLKQALVGKNRSFNDCYNAIKHLEQGDWDKVATYCSNNNIQKDLFFDNYSKSVVIADNLLSGAL